MVIKWHARDKPAKLLVLQLGLVFGEIGGELGTFILLPFIAIIALKLGDWEIFLVSLIGLTLAGSLGTKNPIKGMIALWGLFSCYDRNRPDLGSFPLRLYA